MLLTVDRRLNTRLYEALVQERVMPNDSRIGVIVYAMHGWHWQLAYHDDRKNSNFFLSSLNVVVESCC